MVARYRNKTKKEQPRNTCVVCEGLFKPYRSEQRFCSLKCKNHFHYKQRADAAKAWKASQT